jgi:methionyl-tRNA formyltransferase
VPELRIAVAGNQWITSYLIDALAERGWAPAVVINMGSEWADRISGYEDLAAGSARLGATLYRPSKYSLKSDDDQAALTQHAIDLLFVFGWQRLIPDWLIEHCRKGAFGVHGGPEMPPRCRGRAVFNWAILLGYQQFHMYAFRLTPRVDDGDIVALSTFDILPEDDILTIYHKNCVVSSRLFVRIVEDTIAGKLTGRPQPREGATYLPKREPENGGIDWERPCKRIVDLVRALAPPYPGAFSDCGAARVSIHRAQIFDNKIKYPIAPGRIVDVFPNRHFVVSASDGCIYVRDWSSPNGFLPRKGDTFERASGVQMPDPKF